MALKCKRYSHRSATIKQECCDEKYRKHLRLEGNLELNVGRRRTGYSACLLIIMGRLSDGVSAEVRINDGCNIYTQKKWFCYGNKIRDKKINFCRSNQTFC